MGIFSKKKRPVPKPFANAGSSIYENQGRDDSVTITRPKKTTPKKVGATTKKPVKVPKPFANAGSSIYENQGRNDRKISGGKKKKKR